jgi:hypothetical protein
MRHGLLILGLVTTLFASTGAAAADLARDEGLAPGLYFKMSFGGSIPPAPVSDAGVRTNGFALNETAEGSSTGLSTTTWVVIGVVAAAVIIAVATHDSGGDNGGGGGY